MNSISTSGQLATSSFNKVARVYLRVSTDEQDLQRQEQIIEQARASGCYIAAVYREKASGARPDRPELLRMIADLQVGELVVAEKIDRISRLPLKDAEKLVHTIQSRGAKLAVPGILDLSDLCEASSGVARIVLEAVQGMLLKLALQMARDDYEDRRERQKQGIAEAQKSGRYKGRKPNHQLHVLVISLRTKGLSVSETANLTGYSVSQVKRIWSSFLSGPGQG